MGDRDLYPFAPMGPGGGMLMEPPRGRILLPDRDFPGPGMLPRFANQYNLQHKTILNFRGAVPPGARFDPFMPGGLPGRRGGPDPDHLPMPGGNNFGNMFM